MAILGFTGKMPVAIGLAWKGDSVANIMTAAEKDNPSPIANESMTGLKVTGLFGGTTRILEREATAKRKLYDDKLNLFVTEPESSSVIEEFLALPKGAKLFLEAVFTFDTFFDVLLQQMTRVDADLHNLANPNDPKAILDTFTHTRTGKEVSVTYTPATQKASGLQGTLVDTEVKPPPKGSKIPAVKLMIEIDFGKTPSTVQKDLMRKLTAMDWSKLARFGKEGSERQDVNIWFKNVLRYLLNRTDMSRGENFRQAIIGRQKGKSPLALSKDLRDDLDLHLITANHWGQLREDFKTERHQFLLSDLFGTLHQKAPLSSPVILARALAKLFLANDTDKTAALALQYGTGHCGEHATCSFSVLRSIMGLPGNQVTSIILSGNANVDHAFVVYDLTLDQIILTTVANPNNGRIKKLGANISVFDLKDAIAKNAPRVGFIMDPYLDRTVMKPTAAELLVALHSAKRKKEGRDTDFLAFVAIHPPPDPPVLDITGLPLAQRKAKVPNV